MSDTVRRRQILKDLAEFGISGHETNFLELIPLIEMVWADGRRQPGEMQVLDHYIRSLIARLNAISPADTLTTKQAEKFVLRYLETRPSKELLVCLRDLAIELSTSKTRELLLQACLDIAASAVVDYPYEPDHRFDPAEKQTFCEILASLKAAEAR